MKISDILESFIVEDRLDFIKTNYGPKIKQYIEKDKIFLSLYHMDDVDSFVSAISKADPSRNKSYTQWIIEKNSKRRFST